MPKQKRRKKRIFQKLKKRYSLRGLALCLFVTSKGRFVLSVVVFFTFSTVFFIEHLVAATVVAVTQAVIVRVAAGMISGGARQGPVRSYNEVKALLRALEKKLSTGGGYSTLKKRHGRKTKKRAGGRAGSRVKLVVMEFDGD